MTVHPTMRGTWSIVFSLTFVCGTWGLVQGQGELPPEIDSAGVQTLTRGPVNEAFASPTVADPTPGMIVPKQPPADIKETPPEYQPEGQNVQWFPGYWAWDEDRDDFIWISGVWRDPPPGKRWVPGYWAQVTGGFQWVAGFWIDEQVEEMQYLKPPPQSLEQGPSVASPGDNYFYIPGNWIYANNDYRWSGGYWAPYRENWVYVQPHWVWTPRGCIYVSGYYDWRLPSRGQIFAPVYFNPVVYQRPAYYYTPRCVINTSNLFVHLWVRDSYSHYYFGNYYGQTYSNRQFTPWCNYNSQPRCYDPLLSYCNVHYHQQGVNYSGRMQSWHTHYANNSHANERPPNTWRDQVEYDRNYRGPQAGKARPTHLAQDLQDVIKTPERNWKRQDVAAKNLNKSSIDQIKQLHKLRLDQEKVSLVSLDAPGRDAPGRGLPGTTRPENRDPVVKPGVRPGINLSPQGEVVAAQEALKGKIQLPKTHTHSHKPKVEVPDAPERNIVSRPTINRPDGLGSKPLNNLDQPGSLDNPARVPGLRNPEARNPDLRDPDLRKPAAIVGPKPLQATDDVNPLSRPTTRPQVGTKRPSLSPPQNSLPGNDPSGNITSSNLPDVRPIDKPTGKSFDPKSLTGRDPVAPTRPNLGGGNGSTTSSVQQKLEAIRQQQQDAVNKARNPVSDPVGPKLNPNLGGRNYRTNELPKVNVPAMEAPPRETPRNLGQSGASSAVESRLRDLQSRNSQPRGNLGGNVQPKVEQPRVIQPRIEVSPRGVTPSISPRSFTPAPQPKVAKPMVERAPMQRPAVQVPKIQPPQIQPRNNPVPRSNPQPEAGGNGAEKKRGR